MRSRTLICACALALALLPPAAAAAQVPPPVPATAAGLAAEIAGLADTTARQWAALQDANNQFANPFPADLARGHGAFAPPMLVYALQRAGERTGDAALLAAADRAWPVIVSPARASAFDMVAVAAALRTLTLTAARRAQLTQYLAQYGVPTNGRRCITRPRCYSNLKLVDALALLGITGAGISSPDPAARLGNPAAARAAATDVVNRRIPRVVDHGVRATIAGGPIRGTALSDPPDDPLAYHALSTFMLGEAVAQLGAAASPAALRVQQETRDALSLLVAPDGDASYLGRGQGQPWVPALTAGALAAGARDTIATEPKRAARYLAAAQRAVQRLAGLQAGPQGLQLVPGAIGRTTAEGIDGYAHTVAYNGLALFGLQAALDALAAIPAAPVGPLAADGPLTVQDQRGTGLGVAGNGRTWMAVHKTPTNAGDLRHDFGLLALKRRTPAGWVDLLAPRPLTVITPDSGGPALMRHHRPITPTGFGVHARPGTVTVNGGYRENTRWVRKVQFRWRLTRSGARLRVRGAERGDRFRMLAFTPAGTGHAGRRSLVAAGARWRFDRRIRVRRLRGFHSGPVEQLDAFDVRLTAPRSGDFERPHRRLTGPETRTARRWRAVRHCSGKPGPRWSGRSPRSGPWGRSRRRTRPSRPRPAS